MTPTALRILGIDPGLRITGFGVIELEGSSLRYISSGCIRTDAEAPLPLRLKTIVEGVGEVVDTYRPKEAVIEKVFVNVNPQSTLMLGQARGAAICGLVLAGLDVSEYTALQIKQSVVGHGKAAKEQVQHMVRRLLHLSEEPSPDAADALAAAICHAHGGQGLAPLLQSGYRIRGGRLVR